MDYKTLLGITSALVGGGIVGGQDPSFEYPAVQPKLTSDPIVAHGAPQAGRTEKVAVAGSVAELDRVIAGAIQAIPMSSFAFSLEQQQDAQREKELKELREKMLKEFGPDSEFMKKLRHELGDAKKWQEHAKGLEGKAGVHKLSEQDAKKWEEFHKQMEKRFGAGSDFEKKMKAWGEAYGKEAQKRFGPGSDFEKKMRVWSDEHGKKFEMQFGPGSKFEKEMKAFKLEDGKVRELSAKERAELEKKMAELRVKLYDLKDLPTPPMGEFKFFQTPKAPMVPKVPATPAIPRSGFRRLEAPALPGVPSIPAGPSFSGNSVMEIAKSLTPAQREKNKAQGFLYWSDLKKDQQAKLGARGWTGNWTISVSKDGESFTVKSDRN